MGVRTALESVHRESLKSQIRLSDFGTRNRSVRDDPRKYTAGQQQYLAATQRMCNPDLLTMSNALFTG